MDPSDFTQGLCFKEESMFIEAQEAGVSSCRSTGPKEEFIEKAYDHVQDAQ